MYIVPKELLFILVLADMDVGMRGIKCILQTELVRVNIEKN